MDIASLFESLEKRALLSAVPAAPAALKALPTSATAIKLSWTDKASNESGFKIERGTDGTTFKQLNVIGPNETIYRSGKLTTGRKYYFRVRAFNDAGNSAYSNVAKGTPKSPVSSTPPLAAPTSLKAMPTSDTVIKLTWVDNANNEMGYTVHRSTDGTNFLKIATLAPNETVYRHTNV
jgi:hypothetical protein